MKSSQSFSCELRSLESIESICNLLQGILYHTCMFNVYILAPENEFPEIIYAFFGGRQNISSNIFGTKFVVIRTAKILKIG